MLTSDFDYQLPPELIAQEPLPERDRARMMVLNRAGGGIEHRLVRDLPDLLRPDDLMVVNDTRVIPARLFGRKTATGGRVEVLLIEPLAPDRWHALCKTSGHVRVGDRCRLASDRIDATVEYVAEDGSIELSLAILVSPSDTPPATQSRTEFSDPPDTPDPDLLRILEAEGVTPLPPYIRRSPAAPAGAADRRRYQTVYAKTPGAVAAPTAGLHFTASLLDALDRHGVARAAVTLHVGPGTFRPVTAEHVDAHVMESERYAISEATAHAIEKTRRAGGRILAIGSTTVRTLEHVAALHDGRIVPGTGRVNLFIRPGFRFRVVDMMLTNFHLPRSTLLMMVSALAGRDPILAAYREAVGRRYRFYSYGDCMLILPSARS